mgnify:CR=1 FL=1
MTCDRIEIGTEPGRIFIRVYVHNQTDLSQPQRHALQEAILAILSKEYDHWRDDDSPKGETVPGVRYRNWVWPI